MNLDLPRLHPWFPQLRWRSAWLSAEQRATSIASVRVPSPVTCPSSSPQSSKLKIRLGPPKGTHSFNPASAWAILVSRRGFLVTNDCHTLFLRPEEVSRGRELDHTRLRIKSPSVLQKDEDCWAPRSTARVPMLGVVRSAGVIRSSSRTAAYLRRGPANASRRWWSELGREPAVQHESTLICASWTSGDMSRLVARAAGHELR